ncbi:sensor histidine kinase [Sinorhizobium medicae]|uniref:C4-dicarboxylate transport sensor protein n=2 Tax=Sinorhizobium medicae TaxID=110321 RepID=A0A508X1G7_9HYPH|nr:ATP-binding protein [Sinorhizobium medicae]MDX0520100.1 sensor histidine kinase [Sinorhizobium medicae]MDX0547320.1 sensor histidine kinase [Sinorhizobium medicae]MDX0631440.1 sensor histidine kinase [Sinorhizobium medicae]MDX0712302.1 sensor histidine kinase [Sinorhizobium medicae]MDX0767671.1 sensor histidine kinase [Sinorhizobium medicae]
MMRTIGKMTALMLVLTCIAPFVTYHLAISAATASLEGQLQRSLVVTNRAIETEIDRFRYLPLILGEDARIRALAAGERSPDVLEAANRYLETVVAQAGAAELYVLDERGVALAASNFATSETFVGHDYNFRPYFEDALRTGAGRYYAIGVTTRKPGYFLTSRIDVPGRPPIIVVVKADLLPLEATWKAAGVQTAIADQWGIVFLSGNPDWKYRPLVPLAPEALAQVAKERKYDGVNVAAARPILPASVVTLPPGEAKAPALHVEEGQLMAKFSVVRPDGWLVLASTSTGDTGKVAGFWALATLIAGGLASGMLYFLRQRAILIRTRLRQGEILERKVARRTQDLAREIEMRKRTEDELRNAQEGLVHSEKMAALGRMSTAIVHEVSQPLAALEATLATAGVLLERGGAEKVGGRLLDARALVKRMQRTVKHLKTFARKGASDLEPVDIDLAIRNAMDLAAPKARALGVVPAYDASGPKLVVVAVAVKLEQVLLNLILNALDAVEGRQGATVLIRKAVESGRVKVAVIDNGSGIAPEHRDRIAEPFFTTKLTGEGLGLGLAIATAILREFGGEITFAEAGGGGTIAAILMPIGDRSTLLEAAQ